MRMTPQEEAFRKFVDALFVSKRELGEGFLHASVGLAGEASEILDHMKKHWVYDRPLDRAKVLEEMGDAFHYFMMLCIKMDVTWQDVMDNNVAKLLKRYPNGFSKEAAIARADTLQRPPVVIRDEDHYSHDTTDAGC